jgi:outer membrane protein assembly factor BamB
MTMRKAVMLLAVTLALASAAPSAMLRAGLAADWPQWQGPNRDAVSTETGLLKAWPKEGPPLLWRMEGLGKGFSSVAIVGQTLYTMGDRGGAQYILAFDLKAKKALWEAKVGKGWDDGARCTPTVDGDMVYGLGTDGDLVAVQAADGKEVWRKNFGRDFGGHMMSQWGYSESPLIDGDKLICSPGAKDAMMVALGKKTGDVIWKAAGPDGAGYASPVVSEGGGVRQYVTNCGEGLVSVDAKTGKLLWQNKKIAHGTAHIPTPVVRGDLVFGANGYGGGGILLKLSADGSGGVKAEELKYLPEKQFQNHHGGMALVGDFIYAGSGHVAGQPVCINFKTGEIAWKQDKAPQDAGWKKDNQPGGGSAAVIAADGHIILRYESGDVVMFAASPQGYTQQGMFKPVFQQGASWAHPVILAGCLYLRENDVLMCYDLKAK